MESLNLLAKTADRGAIEGRSTPDAVRPEGDGERFSEALEQRRNDRRERSAERHERLRSERGAESAKAQKLDQTAKTTRAQEARDERPVRERARAEGRPQAETREGASRATTSSPDATSSEASASTDEAAPSIATNVAAKVAAPKAAGAVTTNTVPLVALPPAAAELALELATGTLAVEGETLANNAAMAAESARGAEATKVAGGSEGALAPLVGRDAPQRALENALESTASKETQPKEAPVSPEKAAAMLRQIRVHLHPGLREALIQLEPRELGRISIKVAVRGEAAHAELRVSKRSALEALERSLPELRAALERAGLGGGEVSLQLDLSARDGREDSSFESASGRSRPADAPLPRGLLTALQRHVPTSDGVDTYA
jgi:flagellar hook-length control protein FliK